MIKRKIAIPIYEQCVKVYYGTYGEIKKINHRHRCPKLPESVPGRSIWLDDSNTYLLLLRNDKGITPGGIAHECKHLVNFIYTNLGIKLDVDNDEPECYLLDWLVTKVLSIIKI